MAVIQISGCNELVKTCYPVMRMHLYEVSKPCMIHVFLVHLGCDPKMSLRKMCFFLFVMHGTLISQCLILILSNRLLLWSDLNCLGFSCLQTYLYTVKNTLLPYIFENHQLGFSDFYITSTHQTKLSNFVFRRCRSETLDIQICRVFFRKGKAL